MKKFNGFDWLALAVLAIGGLNWGLIAAFNFDLVSTLFGEMTLLTRVVYGLVGVSALYITITAFMVVESTSPSSRRVAHT